MNNPMRISVAALLILLMALSTALQAAKPTNKAPTVSLTAPANGATFAVGANIALTATASDSDGTISKVEFYRGGSTLIGTATTAPYFITWSNVAAGTYSLTAKATDNGGAATTSTAATITVSSNVPPAVSIATPANGATFTAGSNVVLTATATDSDGTVSRVDYYRGGTTLIGSATTAPFAVTWSSVAAGSYSLTAKATDNAGASTTSAPIGITVNANSPPTVTLNSPADGATYAEGAGIPFDVSASDPNGSVTKVDFYQGSTPLATDTSAPYTYTWNGAAKGSYAVKAVATDNAGSTGESAVANIRVAKLPLVVLTEPSACSSIVGPATVALMADAVGLGVGIQKVAFFDAGVPIGEDTTYPYAVSWNVTAVGTHRITATATDNYGASASTAAVELQVTQNVAPSVSLTSPIDGAVIIRGVTVTLTASAADPDGTVEKVDFYRGETLIGTASSNPYLVSYLVDWNASPEGEHILTAVATDSNGATAQSAEIHVTVAPNVLPTVTLTSPADGAQLVSGASVLLSAAALDSDGAIVQVAFYSGATLIATDTTAPYSATWNNIPVGNQRLTAVATDNSGETSTSVAVNVTVNMNTPPTVSVTNPINGAQIAAGSTVTLSASAVDSDGAISGVTFYRGTTFIGTDTVAPYTSTWSNVASGSYSLTAVATDNSGAVTTSAAINVTVAPNILPSIALTSPVDAAQIPSNSSVTLTASASDVDGTINYVTFYRGTTSVGTDYSAPYSATWSNVAVGSYSLTAKATDNTGGATTSSPVNVTVITNTPSTVSLTSPTNGAKFAIGTSVQLTATAADPGGAVTKVDFYRGSTLLGSDATAPYSATWSNIAAGSYSLTAKATDSSGVVTTSAGVSVTVVANNPPTVSLTAPTNGATFIAPADIILSASATDTDGTVTSVEFYEGATRIGSDSSAPYSVNWTGVADGSYVVTAKAIDDTGNVTTSTPANISVISTPLTITAPLNGETITSGSVLVVGMASGAPLNSGVTVNGTVAILDSNGKFYANDVPLIDGVNTLTATLTTPSGEVYEQNISVVSAPQMGAASIVPDDLEGFVPHTVKFAVGVPDGATIQLLELDYNADGSVDLTYTNPSFTSFNLTYSVAGTYQLLLRVTDSLNTVTEKKFVINVITPAMLDISLRSVYTNMIDNLNSGNVSGALTAFSPNAVDKYAQVFADLGGNLSSVVSGLGTLNDGGMTSDWAEYVIIRDTGSELQGFPIYFIRGDDGVWRIESM